jgi:hypothetical protein
MGGVDVAMPDHGSSFATGVNTDEATFKRLPDTIGSAHCPHSSIRGDLTMHGYGKSFRPAPGWKM